MEVLVEATDSLKLPKGCFVSVRVGDTLKQRRFDKATAKYLFPAPETKRRAKIDVYQLVGTCAVSVDADFAMTDEVSVASTNPEVEGMKLRVSTSAKNMKADAEVNQRKESETESKEAAVSYLSSHGIEQRLSECLRSLLRMKPDDPIDFICKQLKAGGPTIPTPIKKDVPPPVGSTPAAKKEPEALCSKGPQAPTTGPKSQLGAGPFRNYYTEHFGSLGSMDSLYSKFPAAKSKQSVAQTPKAPAAAPSGAAGSCFTFKPSVGTWLMKNSTATPVAPAKAAPKSSQLSMPFKDYYTTNIHSSDSDAMQKLYSQFSTTGSASKTSEAEAGKAPTGSCFAFKPSVGTWLMKNPAAKAGPPASAGPWAVDPRGAFRLNGLSDSCPAARCEAERVLSKALLELDGDLEGEYFPLSSSYPLRPGGILPEELKELESKCLTFKAADACGTGVFVTQKGHVAFWVNACKHLQILVKKGLSDEEVVKTLDAAASSLYGSLCQDGYALKA